MQTTGVIQRFKKLNVNSLVNLREFPVLVATLFLIILLTFLNENFIKTGNIINVVRQSTLIIILAVGEAFVLISGEVDISIGAVMGLSGIMAAILSVAGFPVVLVLFLTLAIGASIGVINALLVVKLRIMSFVATLGTLSILKGVMLIITGGFSVKFESPLAFLGYGLIGIIPLSVILMLVIVVIMHVILSKTTLGREVFATGSNYKAARISGVAVVKIKIFTFALAGLLAAFAGIILTGNLLISDPTAGVGYEMDVVAACIIGGTTLKGGEGSIIGVVFGCILMSLMRNGFVLLGVSSSWQTIAAGLVIVLSIILDSWKNNRNGV